MPRPAFRHIALPSQVPYVDRMPPEARATRRRLRACHECDWLMALPPLHSGEQAVCPRCGHAEVRRHRYPAQRSLALAIAALASLAIAAAFPFLAFSVRGVGNRG